MNNIAILQAPVQEAEVLESVVKTYETFDFTVNDVEVFPLEVLKRTYKENDINGNPVKGLYHFQTIERVAELCRQNGLSFEVEEIFAAQNKNKTQPGVVILPQVETQFQEKAVEAHVLRRVFTTIRINDEETTEHNTTIAIAFHQDGLQAAMGANVKICHNQCILSPERTVSNYGKNKVSNEEFFNRINDWLLNFSQNRVDDIRIIERMKQVTCSLEEVQRLIGLLTCMRVAKDSKHKKLSAKVANCYPLNQTQINRFSEDCLLRFEKPAPVTLWDVYNIATELYKANRMEIPNLIPQNAALAEILKEEFCI